MKTTITPLLLTLFVIQVFGQTGGVQAQETDSMKTMPIQISFIPPMSTNGIDNHKVVNRVSVNIFAGYSGGTNGLEIGSFVNIDKRDMTGGQFGGFANVVGGNVTGVQAAGFTNATLGKVDGAQFAGFHNFAADSLRGTQAAGFNNVVKGGIQGAQLSGFANLATASSKGFQASGFVNTVSGNLLGTQAAGFVNVCTDSLAGGQAAGFVNYTKKSKGAQVAGFTNICAQDMQGIQVSGFVNYAKSVKGAQISFLNIADTVDGVSIGFFSFVLKGYHKFEIKGTEVLHVNGAFKTGVNRFYNIFSVGANFSDKTRWAYGYGIGTYLPFSEKTALNLDLVAHHINEEESWTGDLNLLNRLDINFNYKLAKYFELAAGPALNVMVSRYYDAEKNQLGSTIAPYSFYNHTTSGGTNIKMWLGASVAMKF